MSAGVGLRNGSVLTVENTSWQRTLRLSLADAALSTTLQTLTTGVFLTGFGLAIGASQIQIGILAALPTLGNVAQIVGSYFIERTGQRKWLCLWAALIARTIWFAILTAPLVIIGQSRSAVAWWIVLMMAASSGIAAVGGVAWLSWMKDLVPNGHRADFLSRRNQIGTGLALTLSIAAGLFLDWWNMRWQDAVGGFGVVFGVAAACGLGALPFLWATPDAPMPIASRREPFSRFITLPFRDSNFLRLVIFYAFWNLGVNLASPFFNVYMLRELHLPFWFVTLVTTIAGVSSLAANRFWVRLSAHFGNKPIVFLATLGNAFFPLPWIFIDRPWAWVLLLVHLSGVFNSVLVLGPNNIMFKLAPDRNASAYLAVFNAIVGPATAVAPVLGGLLASALGAVHWSLGPAVLSGVKFVFLASFVLRLSSLLLIHRVAEPESKGVGHVVRVLRNVGIPSLTEDLPAVLALRRDARATRTPKSRPTRERVRIGAAPAPEPCEAA
jgi:MFS family permease